MPAQSERRSFMSVICCTSDDIVGTLSANRMRNRADRPGPAPLLVVRRCGLAACNPRSAAPVRTAEMSEACLDEMNHSSPRRLARTPIQPARSRRRRMRAASRAYQRLTRHESQRVCCGSAGGTAPVRCSQQLAAVKLAALSLLPGTLPVLG